MWRKHFWVKVLVVTNIVTLSCFSYLVIHDKVPQRFLAKFVTVNTPIEPEEYSGYIYANETIESLVYNRKGFEIIMLGDSLTCHNNWGDLLKRDDIANYGIGGDTTENVIKRIKDVNLVSPKRCFLMIGINDIFGNKPLEEIKNNYKIIVR